MVKLKKKIVLSVALLGMVGISMTIGAIAASNSEEIRALLAKNITIKKDGKVWEPKNQDGETLYPIMYNDSTYLPVRAVGEAFGVKIGWDDATWTVLLGEEAKPADTVGLSRSNPAGVGTAVDFSVKNILDEYSGSLKLLEVVRGDKALQMMKEANQFNSDPKEEYEYLLAKVEYKLAKNKNKDAQVDVNGAQFTAVSSAGRDYDTLFGVAPDPSINTKLYVGASHTGWVVLQVAKDDKSPVITYGRSYDGTGGAWFKLQ